MTVTLKAYMVFCDDTCDGCLLVYAINKNQARYFATKGIWSEVWEYSWLSALRRKKWDQYAIEPGPIDTNNDLPKGAEPFYLRDKPYELKVWT